MDSKYDNYIKHNKLSKAETELELRSLDHDSFEEYSGSSIKVEAFKNDGSCYPEEYKILFLVDDYRVFTLAELNNFFKPVYDESEDW